MVQVKASVGDEGGDGKENETETVGDELTETKVRTD